MVLHFAIPFPGDSHTGSCCLGEQELIREFTGTKIPVILFFYNSFIINRENLENKWKSSSLT